VPVDRDALRLRVYDVDTKWLEQMKDATGLRGAGRVMIPGDHHHCRVGKHLHQPRKLEECVEDRGIRGANGVKDIARDENDIGTQLDHGVDHPTQRRRDVGLPLIDSGRRLPLVLPEPKMYVGKVNQSHRARIARIHWVIFVRTCIGAPFGSPRRSGADSMVDRTMMLLLESVIQPSRRSI